MKRLAWMVPVKTGIAALAMGLFGCTADVADDEADTTQKHACYTPENAVCDAPPPTTKKSAWRHAEASALTTSAGAPHHRGRDLFVLPGENQWVLAKFAYGVVDKDLKDEDVDIYLSRGCGQSWELLGTARTSSDAKNATVEGVADTGGRIYFEIPADKRLGLGRHRLHLVVRGDASSTELFIQVVKNGTKIFVSDVDGTLTSSETVELWDSLVGQLPNAHPHAAEALSALAAHRLIPFYLTARPEGNMQRTRDFLAERGFPPGIVHTTLTGLGAMGDAAATFKSNELVAARGKTLDIVYGFGNRSSDTIAYEKAAIQPVKNRVFYQLDDQEHGGRRIDDYGELLGEFSNLPTFCK